VPPDRDPQPVRTFQAFTPWPRGFTRPRRAPSARRSAATAARPAGTVEQREGRRLTVKAYQEIGKLEGALQRRADATLKAFSQEEQELCRHTFLRLTQPGEGTEDTKRRVSMQELLSVSGKSTAEADIIQKLADASLLTTIDDLTHKDAFVEV
jgi:hypothetical protein